MPEDSLTSPEGILMLLVAGILDFLGLILFFLSWLGGDDYGLLDVLGLFIIGGWMFMRTGTFSATKKSIKKIGLTFGIELIPFLGGITPSWIIAVYRELKN